MSLASFPFLLKQSFHCSQSNLRLVKDDSDLGVTVHHDHSLRRALNRGNDFKEGEQSDFVEDHGFLIQARASAPRVLL